MSQPFRIADSGTVIDRDRPLSFSFNGKRYEGYRGDTLASALLANGVRLVGRSFKYHRPRGVFAAGVEEPNALVRLGARGPHRPNLRATEIPLFEGLEAHSQNCWPSVGMDLGAAAGWLGPLLPAGFYYKTFIGPARAWPFYERLIRKAAGLGEAPWQDDGARYEKRHLTCDVLVIGAGPAGLMAALSAARRGARVILADERSEAGGGLLDEAAYVAGQPANRWVRDTASALEAMENVRLVLRTTVFGRYRHGRYGLVQHTPSGQVHLAVVARRAVLAAGGVERPLVFAGNDRPGVMLAGAVRRYVRCYGVLPGRRAVIFTNNDSAYETARCLLGAGAAVEAIIDLREGPPPSAMDHVEVLTAAGITGVLGRRRVKAVELRRGAERRRIACDLLCVSGGWTPTVHLYAHGGLGRLIFDERRGGFVPADREVSAGMHPAGLCNGTDGLTNILIEGWRAGNAAASAAVGGASVPEEIPEVAYRYPERSVHASSMVEVGHGRGKPFVDLQDDVTVRDLEIALREGYRSIEHVKRYTTLGMGTDQGRTSNINGMHIVAERLGCPVREVGTTTFRPPYTPVSLGALAGRESGPRIAPLRRSPMHDCHARNGAVFMPSALWVRPQFYRNHGRSLTEAAKAEAANVRRNVGMADVSTLGKIEIQGRDAGEFLNRVYMNRCGNVRMHRARYGVMLREDGFVFDDGTVVRLSDNRFLISTTTVNAGAVLSHLEFHQQMIWPELDVMMAPVTEQWAVVALAGPSSRDVLERLLADVDVSNGALPFLGFKETAFLGAPARLFRISFSGERAYEIAVPSDYGEALWEALLAAGEPFGIMPYGLEAMDYLRIEKGHLVVGADIDGRVTPYNLGMQGMIRDEEDFVGARSLRRPALSGPDQPGLAGFVSADAETPVPAGAQLVERPYDGSRQASLGRITSPGFSVALNRPVALGFIAGEFRDKRVFAVSPLTGEQAEVTVTEPVFYDSKGDCLRG